MTHSDTHKYLEEITRKGLWFYTNSIPKIWSIYALSIGNSVINILMPFFLIMMISNLLFITSPLTYIAFAIGYVLIGTLWGIIGYTRDSIFANLLLQYSHRISTEAFGLITRLPYSYLSNLPVESQYTRYIPLDNFTYVWLNEIVRPLLDLPLVIFSFTIICILLGFGYFACILVILLFILSLIHLKSTVTKNNKSNVSDTEYHGALKDTLDNLNLLQDHDRAEYFSQRNLELINKKIEGNYLNDTKTQILGNIIEVSLLLIYITGLILGSYYALEGMISMQNLIIILLLTWFSINPLKSMLNVIDEINKAKDILKQYSTLLQINQPKNRQKKIFLDHTHSGTIELQNVSLRFPNGSKFILNNINFSVNRGELLLIKGDSGSGKSTILKLIAGLLSPSAGYIILDHDIGLIDENSLQDKIIFLSHNSIFEDLSMANNLNLAGNEFDNISMPMSHLKKTNSSTYPELVNEIILSKLPSNLQNKIILLDEPFITHDLQVYNQISQVILSLIPNNTIIIASRYEYYATLANKLLLLKNGSVVNYLIRKTDTIADANGKTNG